MIAGRHESPLKSRGWVAFHRRVQGSAAGRFVRRPNREVMTEEFLRDRFTIDLQDEFTSTTPALMILFAMMGFAIFLIIGFSTAGASGSNNHRFN